MGQAAVYRYLYVCTYVGVGERDKVIGSNFRIKSEEILDGHTIAGLIKSKLIKEGKGIDRVEITGINVSSIHEEVMG